MNYNTLHVAIKLCHDSELERFGPNYLYYEAVVCNLLGIADHFLKNRAELESILDEDVGEEMIEYLTEKGLNLSNHI